MPEYGMVELEYATEHEAEMMHATWAAAEIELQLLYVTVLFPLESAVSHPADETWNMRGERCDI